MMDYEAKTAEIKQNQEAKRQKQLEKERQREIELVAKRKEVCTN